MSRQKRILLKKAAGCFKKIRPVGGRRSFEDCFTCVEGRLCFWFDTPDHSTHVLMMNASGSSREEQK